MDNNALQNKHLLIVTGPQGSGNHLFSRIFSMHAKVKGWDALLEQYWVPSDQEPFAEYWVNPHQLPHKYFDDADYFVANVSVPFFYNGVRQIPKIEQLINRVQSFGIRVTLAFVVRDRHINVAQQLRVGGEATISQATDLYRDLIDKGYTYHFIDHEAFFLWDSTYTRYLSKLLDFPIDHDYVLHMVDQSPNAKYVTPVQEHWLDKEIRAGRRPFQQRQQDILGE